MIRQIVLALVLLLAGCCTCPEPQQPEPEPRLGDVAAITSSLDPLINLGSAAFISSILWVESAEIRPGAHFKKQIELQAAYARQDIVAYRPGSEPTDLAHEVLHAFWEHQLVPERAEFINSMNTVLSGTSEHESYVREVIANFDQMVKSSYPDATYDTEMYAYIGNMIMSEHSFCIPEIILQHYRGVLNQSLLDRRVCAQSD